MNQILLENTSQIKILLNTEFKNNSIKNQDIQKLFETISNVIVNNEKRFVINENKIIILEDFSSINKETEKEITNIFLMYLSSPFTLDKYKIDFLKYIFSDENNYNTLANNIISILSKESNIFLKEHKNERIIDKLFKQPTKDEKFIDKVMKTFDIMESTDDLKRIETLSICVEKINTHIETDNLFKYIPNAAYENNMEALRALEKTIEKYLKYTYITKSELCEEININPNNEDFIPYDLKTKNKKEWNEKINFYNEIENYIKIYKGSCFNSTMEHLYTIDKFNNPINNNIELTEFYDNKPLPLNEIKDNEYIKRKLDVFTFFITQLTTSEEDKVKISAMNHLLFVDNLNRKTFSEIINFDKLKKHFVDFTDMSDNIKFIYLTKEELFEKYDGKVEDLFTCMSLLTNRLYNYSIEQPYISQHNLLDFFAKGILFNPDLMSFLIEDELKNKNKNLDYLYHFFNREINIIFDSLVEDKVIIPILSDYIKHYVNLSNENNKSYNKNFFENDDLINLFKNENYLDFLIKMQEISIEKEEKKVIVLSEYGDVIREYRTNIEDFIIKIEERGVNKSLNIDKISHYYNKTRLINIDNDLTLKEYVAEKLIDRKGVNNLYKSLLNDYLIGEEKIEIKNKINLGQKINMNF